MISILQESRIILTPDQEHKTDIHNIHVAGFRNGKSLKDKLVRTTSYKMLKKQEGLNHKGRETFRSISLYGIEIRFLPKPVMKHLRF